MMSQDERDEVLRRMKAGERVCDIARAMGRHQSTISNLVQKARKSGALAPYRKHRIDHAKITQLAKKGIPPKQIAKKTGCRYDAVLLSMRISRAKGDLPPKRRACPASLMAKIGLRVGPVKSDMIENLSSDEWDWLINNADADAATLSSALIKAVIIAARDDA